MLNYQVVLADGRIVNANANTNADLFKALKGGSNNFGVVTRIDMQTLPATLGGIYGGLVFLSYDHKQVALQGLVDMIQNADEESADTQALTLGYNSPGPARVATIIVNTDGVQDSPAFAKVEALPAMIKDVRRRTYGDLITTFVTPGNDRYVGVFTKATNVL